MRIAPKPPCAGISMFLAKGGGKPEPAGGFELGPLFSNAGSPKTISSGTRASCRRAVCPRMFCGQTRGLACQKCDFGAQQPSRNGVPKRYRNDNENDNVWSQNVTCHSMAHIANMPMLWLQVLHGGVEACQRTEVQLASSTEGKLSGLPLLLLGAPPPELWMRLRFRGSKRHCCSTLKWAPD